ncbi:hypothetical protein Agub_g4013, partial [Astrephomene gubernaculifera]
ALDGACQEALRHMAAEVTGLSSDAADLAALVRREVDKRFEQLSSRYPAYPDIVWLDVWEETEGRWLAQSLKEELLCKAAAERWSTVVVQLKRELWEVMRGDIPAVDMRAVSVAGACTGHFGDG